MAVDLIARQTIRLYWDPWELFVEGDGLSQEKAPNHFSNYVSWLVCIGFIDKKGSGCVAKKAAYESSRSFAAYWNYYFNVYFLHV